MAKPKSKPMMSNADRQLEALAAAARKQIKTCAARVRRAKNESQTDKTIRQCADKQK